MNCWSDQHIWVSVLFFGFWNILAADPSLFKAAMSGILDSCCCWNSVAAGSRICRSLVFCGCWKSFEVLKLSFGIAVLDLFAESANC